MDCVSKEERRSFFKLVYLLPMAVVAGCNLPFPDTSGSEVSFVLIDVGQGLSQMVVQNNRAMLFDMGPVEAEKEWKSAYTTLGKPQIEAIIISHRDLDHSGGLGFLDSSTVWSGRLIASRWEDTTFLRLRCSKWHGPILIETIVQDTVIPLSDDCSARCLWPPPVIDDTFPVPDAKTNYYSVVCLIVHGNSRIMITGDIDSVAERLIALHYTAQIRADIVVVPHHGSASGVYPLFFGYLRSSLALLSYGEGNSYGHPSAEVLSMLSSLGIHWRTTSDEGSIQLHSNGWYWVEAQ
jgi:competence protein ComEC